MFPKADDGSTTNSIHVAVSIGGGTSNSEFAALHSDVVSTEGELDHPSQRMQFRLLVILAEIFDFFEAIWIGVFKGSSIKGVFVACD